MGKLGAHEAQKSGLLGLKIAFSGAPVWFKNLISKLLLKGPGRKSFSFAGQMSRQQGLGSVPEQENTVSNSTLVSTPMFQQGCDFKSSSCQDSSSLDFPLITYSRWHHWAGETRLLSH